MIGPAELAAGLARVRGGGGGAGVDGVRAEAFDERALGELARELAAGRYRPRALLPVARPKGDGRVRVLRIPCVRDRVVQAAVLARLEPRERTLSTHVHGYRRGRSVDTALADLRRQVGRRGWIELARLDVAELFDQLPHACVRATARGIDRDCDALLDRWLRDWGTAPDRGVPQGAPLSPLLSNLALARVLDAHLREPWVRYADDLLLVDDHVGGWIRRAQEARGLLEHAGLALAAHKVAVAVPGALPAVVALGQELRIARVGRHFQLVQRPHPRP